MAKRYDNGRLDAPVRTPQGFLRVPATIARTGVQTYAQADGSIRREYRPADEVFKADALASFALAPITLHHPPEPVTAANAGKYARGTLGETLKADGQLVTGTALITHADAIEAIEKQGLRELSCGYECDVEMTAGTAPDGTRYDGIQRNIRGNHVAIVKVGRAGPEVRLKLDSNNDAVPDAAPIPEGAKPMEKIVINGVTFEVSAQVAQALQAKFKADADTLAAEQGAHAAAKAAAEAAKARADVAEGKAAAAEKARADALDPKQLDAAVSRRVTLIGVARSHLGAEFKADGKSEELIKREVLAKVAPTIKLDGQPVAYVDAAFDAAVAIAKPSAAHPVIYDTGGGGGAGGEDLEAKARAEMKKKNAERLDEAKKADAARN